MEFAKKDGEVQIPLDVNIKMLKHTKYNDLNEKMIKKQYDLFKK